MSVQSQINRIVSEVSDQSDLIAQIMGAMGGKAAGGGSFDMGAFSQILCGTVTPASDLSTFTIPAEITDEIALFAIGYAGEEKLPGDYFHTSVWAGFVVNPTGSIQNVSASIYGTSSQYSGKISLSGNTVSFSSSYRPRAGYVYAYIICAVENRSEVHSSTTGGGSN